MIGTGHLRRARAPAVAAVLAAAVPSGTDAAWTVRSVPGSAARFRVENETIGVSFFHAPSTSQYAWNIEHLEYRAIPLIGPHVANGTVLNGDFRNPAWRAWGGDAGGWVGTAHRGETNVGVCIVVDGATNAFSVTMQLAGQRVTVVRSSRMGPVDLTAAYAFAESGDGLRETFTYRVARDTAGFRSMYAFMHCMKTNVTRWIGIRGDGSEAEQARAPVAPGGREVYHPTLGDLKAAVFWAEAERKGLVFLYPEVYPGGGARHNVVSRGDSTKYYFSPDTRTAYAPAAGRTFSFSVRVMPFEAAADGWRDEGRRLARGGESSTKGGEAP